MVSIVEKKGSCMYNLEELKKMLMSELHELHYLKSTETLKPITPGHGSCCTCQTCGRDYDDCVCYSNGLIETIDGFFEEQKDTQRRNKMEVTENDIRKFDEAATALMRTIPGYLWNLFTELKKQGFTEVQALELTKKSMEKLC